MLISGLKGLTSLQSLTELCHDILNHFFSTSKISINRMGAQK